MSDPDDSQGNTAIEQISSSEQKQETQETQREVDESGLENTITPNAPQCYGLALCDREEKVDAYVIERIDELTETIVIDPSFFGAEDRDLSDLYILSPFHIWEQNENECHEQVTSFWYPIASKGKIVCVITIFELNGTLHYNVSNQLVKELNSICVDNKNRILVEETKGNNFNYHFELDARNSSEHDESENVFLNISGKYIAK